MPLTSELFTREGPGKKRLADCAVSPQSNFYVGKPILPGTEDAVARIQTALRSLGFTISDAAGVYGSSTARAVFAFKSAHRPKPILGPGQTVPDSVVGIQTIAALDSAMAGKPPGPTPPGPTPPPKPTTQRAWTFKLEFRADPRGVVRFRLELIDPDDTTNRRFFFLRHQDATSTFQNTLGASVNANREGTLPLPNDVILDDIPGCFAAVLFVPTPDGAVLNGQLSLVEQDKKINAQASVTGNAEGRASAGGKVFVAATLEQVF